MLHFINLFRCPLQTSCIENVPWRKRWDLTMLGSFLGEEFQKPVVFFTWTWKFPKVVFHTSCSKFHPPWSGRGEQNTSFRFSWPASKTMNVDSFSQLWSRMVHNFHLHSFGGWAQLKKSTLVCWIISPRFVVKATDSETNTGKPPFI